MSNLAAFLFGVSAGMALCLLITLSIMAWFDWRDSRAFDKWLAKWKEDHNG